MSQRLSNRKVAWIAMGVAIAGVLSYAVKDQDRHADKSATGASSRNEQEGAQRAYVVTRDDQSRSTTASGLKIKADAILASVNGRLLRAGDVLPPGASNQTVTPVVCQYFVQRAINRELIVQAARDQGVRLDDSQNHQLRGFQLTRAEPAPGQVRNLNGGPAETSFEAREAEAFILQTSLMQQLGVSPNVSSEQVEAYYQQHASEFGALPADESARRAAWNAIDVQIRERLASEVRGNFQNQLTAYMSQLKAKADIQVTPLTSFANAQ